MIQRNTNQIDYTATVWRDEISDLSRARATEVPGKLTYSAFRTPTNAWVFGTTATIAQGVEATFHVNHDYRPGSSAYIHVHSSPMNAGLSGTVNWKVAWTYARGHNQSGPTFTAFPACQTISLPCVVSATQYQHQITEVEFGSMLEVDTLIKCYLYRDTTSGDTCAGDVAALFLDFHYQADRNGTSTKAPTWDT